jgi:cytochrome c551/c552
MSALNKLMKKYFILTRGLYFLQIIILSCVFHAEVFSQDGEANFKKACASCHSIGNGRLVGPDLQGITFKKDNEWLVKFISNSPSLISSGDADAVAIAKEFNNSVMPPVTLSTVEINAILTFIESKGAAGPKKKTVDYLLKATTENIIAGYQLFTGKIPFKEGGATCISCHTVNCLGNGGILAKDLTFSYNTMKGEGIKALLQSPAFPAMLTTYTDHPLQEDEIYNLAAFLRSTATHQTPTRFYEANGFPLFYIIGVAGFLFLAILFFAGWHMRKRKSVNHDIFKRQLKTE